MLFPQAADGSHSANEWRVCVAYYLGRIKIQRLCTVAATDDPQLRGTQSEAEKAASKVDGQKENFYYRRALVRGDGNGV